ncbi:MAG: Fic family protein, partial [Terriglobales bacterium]
QNPLAGVFFSAINRDVRRCPGVRDKGAVEAAVFRPQIGYYKSIEEEAAALMGSPGNNHGFLDGNKRIAFTATNVFLRRNGFCIEVEGPDGHAFIGGSMDPAGPQASAARTISTGLYAARPIY